jgi:hypothetical protein
MYVGRHMSLNELLADDLVQAVMLADRVSASVVRTIIAIAAGHLPPGASLRLAVHNPDPALGDRVFTKDFVSGE